LVRSLAQAPGTIRSETDKITPTAWSDMTIARARATSKNEVSVLVERPIAWTCVGSNESKVRSLFLRISRIAIGRPMQITCSISGVVTPKRMPKRMCDKLIWLGTFDMRTVPSAKNVVNTMPIAVSGRTI